MAGKTPVICTLAVGVIVAASLYCAITVGETAQFLRNSYISTRRAFVTVTRLEVQPAYSGSDPKQLVGWTFAPIVKNNGPTPTRSLTLRAGIQSTRDSGGPEDPEAALHNRSPIRLLIGPHTTVELPVTSSLDFLIANDAIQKVASGQADAYVFGTVHYKDIFERTRLHVTRFCFRIDARGDGSANTSVAYHFCGFWNCADYECVVDKAEHGGTALEPGASK